MSENTQTEWTKAQTFYRLREEKGSTGKYILAEITNLRDAFTRTDRALRCIDEGTPGGFHMAGSGILEQEEARRFFADAKLSGVYSHEGCGAAAKFAADNGITDRPSDELGKDWSRNLAETLGVPYLGHITAEEMTRPSDLHNATVVYYDGTGSFNPAKAEGLPPGFVVSRRYLSKESAVGEALLSAAIALGDHGFGELFTADRPFVIVPIGDSESDEFSLENLTRELAQSVKDYHGRVVVEGFEAPEIKVAPLPN